jgi:hypothetical protein
MDGVWLSVSLDTDGSCDGAPRINHLTLWPNGDSEAETQLGPFYANWFSDDAGADLDRTQVADWILEPARFEPCSADEFLPPGLFTCSTGNPTYMCTSLTWKYSGAECQETVVFARCD